MRRVVRLAFNGLAAASVLLLVFIAWLGWGGGEPLIWGRVEAWRVNDVVLAGALADAGHSWHRQAGKVLIGRISNSADSLLIIQLPRWLALSLASAAPAAWVAMRIGRRRVSRGFAVESLGEPAPLQRTATGVTSPDPQHVGKIDAGELIGRAGGTIVPADDEGSAQRIRIA